MSLLSKTLRFGRPMATVAILAAGVLAAGGMATPAHYNLDTYQTWGNYPFNVRSRFAPTGTRSMVWRKPGSLASLPGQVPVDTSRPWSG